MGRFAVFVVRVAWSLALCGLADGGAVAAELKLSWEVVQPFRFFRYPSDQAVQEWAYQDVQRAGTSPDRIVSAMENTLNSVAWWNGRPAGSQKSRREMLDDLRRFEERRLNRPFVKFEPRLGWASALRAELGTSPAMGTCWDPAEKTRRGCVSDIGQMSGRRNNNYLMPKRHMVSLRVMEKTAGGWKPRRGKCEFNLVTKPKAGIGLLPDPLSRWAERQRIKDADCAEAVYLRTEYKTSYEVSAEVEDGTSLRSDVAVKDILVVGIGDSFASGEGNPEVPADLDEQQGISPYITVSGNIVNPARENVIIPTRKRAGDGRIAGGTAARWLDDQCHRSIYSAQARTAIADYDAALRELSDAVAISDQLDQETTFDIQRLVEEVELAAQRAGSAYPPLAIDARSDIEKILSDSAWKYSGSGIISLVSGVMIGALTKVTEWEMRPAVRFLYRVEELGAWRDAFAFVCKEGEKWGVVDRGPSRLQERKRQHRINEAQIAAVHRALEKVGISEGQ